jgi:hypothetical protein
MPVIRTKPEPVALSSERHRELVGQLSRELAGKPTRGGPVIFEIPLDQRDEVDVFVVWQAWEGLRWEDRSSVILEAYQGLPTKVAQPLGVTYDEAVQQGLLPYAIEPNVHRGEKADEGRLRDALLKQGAIELPDRGGTIRLLFPNRRMAESACDDLRKAVPEADWSIVQNVGSVQEWYQR